ncbi:MAG: mannanase, partial [Melioribacteraceae bacterium]|nr:mannanase [Melioribacteraceae bacterium]
MIKKITLLFVSIIVFQACSGLFTGGNEFVSVSGHQFVKDGKPYYFMGTNFWYGCYLGSPGETGDRERLIRELDFLVENNITNLRVLASSEESSIKNSLKP